jgi:hypothetical protein
MPSYYKNWDSVDLEAEAQRIESDESVVYDKTTSQKGTNLTQDYTGMTPEQIK